jgi:hypothetical protein
VEDVASLVAAFRSGPAGAGRARPATGVPRGDGGVRGSPASRVGRHLVCGRAGRRAAGCGVGVQPTRLREQMAGGCTVRIRRNLERLAEAYRNALCDPVALHSLPLRPGALLPGGPLRSQGILTRWESLTEAWRGRLEDALAGPEAAVAGPSSAYHPAWLRLVAHPAARALLPDWPLCDDAAQRDPRYAWRIPHSLYSAGHIPFHLLHSAAEPCPGRLERCLLAAAGETLRLLQPATEAGRAVGYTAAEWERHVAALRARYGNRAAQPAGPGSGVVRCGGGRGAPVWASPPPVSPRAADGVFRLPTRFPLGGESAAPDAGADLPRWVEWQGLLADTQARLARAVRNHPQSTVIREATEQCPGVCVWVPHHCVRAVAHRCEAYRPAPRRADGALVRSHCDSRRASRRPLASVAAPGRGRPPPRIPRPDADGAAPARRRDDLLGPPGQVAARGAPSCARCLGRRRQTPPSLSSPSGTRTGFTWGSPASPRRRPLQRDGMRRTTPRPPPRGGDAPRPWPPAGLSA